MTFDKIQFSININSINSNKNFLLFTYIKRWRYLKQSHLSSCNNVK